MDNNKILQLIKLAVDNNLITLEELQEILEYIKQKTSGYSEFIRPTGSFIGYPRIPEVEYPRRGGAIVEDPRVREFEALERERRQREGIREMEYPMSGGAVVEDPTIREREAIERERREREGISEMGPLGGGGFSR